MVKERQPLHARCEGKVHGQLGRAMAPCQLARVLLQRVLRVVDHEVSAGKELHVPLVLAVNRKELSRVGHLGLMARVRLVIGGVDHHHAAGFQAVTHRKPGVVQVTGGDLNGAKVKGALAEARGSESWRRAGQVSPGNTRTPSARRGYPPGAAPNPAARRRPIRFPG